MVNNDYSNVTVFACWSKSKKNVKNSSSGGLFYSIASEMIRQFKASVYGAVIESGVVFHKRATTINGIIPMMGSKYVRSELRCTFSECLLDLVDGRYVLFSGTPCQINALYYYLESNNFHNFDKLISIDIICHGTPQPKYWKEYLSLNFNGKSIDDISFRYKEKGWKDYKVKIGDYVTEPLRDPFFNAFLSNKILCESCYSCKCKGENRKACITLGDFWGIENIDYHCFNKNGVSVLLVRNNNAIIKKLLNKKVKLYQLDYSLNLFKYNPAYYRSFPKNEKPFDLLIKKQKRHYKYHKSFKGFLKNIVYYHNSIFTFKGKKHKSNIIGIITDYGYINFGNRLQNYALLETLRKKDKKVINIVHREEEAKPLFKILLHLFGRNKKYTNCLVNSNILNVSKQYENGLFEFSKVKHKQKKLCKFDTIIVGSDQVWNADYHPNISFFLGDFGIRKRPFKLVSYAASICNNYMDEDRNIMYKEYLKEYDYITVREDAAKERLDGIGVNNSVVVLDPTLIYGRENWDLAIERFAVVKVPECNYKMFYLFDNSVQYDKLLDNEMCVFFIGKKMPEKATQFDFINHIKHASLVITDSFHGLCFSVIYKKRVILKKRYLDKQEERFKTLLSFFNLDVIYDKEIDFSTIDYSYFDKMIMFSKSELEKIISL